MQTTLLFDSVHSAQEVAFMLRAEWDGCNAVTFTNLNQNDQAFETAIGLVLAEYCILGDVSEYTQSSCLEYQSLVLKEIINIGDVNFKFLVKTSNILYSETPLTEKIRGVLNIDNAPNKEKEGKFVVKTSPLEFITTVAWEYTPDYSPKVLRLWITKIEQDFPQAITQQKQDYLVTKQHMVNRNTKLKRGFELLNSDEFVNACLTIGTITLIFSAIMFPLLNFRNKLNQGQQTSLILTASRQC